MCLFTFQFSVGYTHQQVTHSRFQRALSFRASVGRHQRGGFNVYKNDDYLHYVFDKYKWRDECVINLKLHGGEIFYWSFTIE